MPAKQDYATLVYIIEQTLGQPLTIVPDMAEFLNLPANIVTNDYEAIANFIQNPQLINYEFINSLVKQQLRTFNSTPELEFKLVPNPQQDWDVYLDNLESVVQQIQYRHANNYELNRLMPPQKQVLELMQECIDLTEAKYGAGNGNISCFYMYFLQMCDAAHITRYKYCELDKKISQDQYISLIDTERRNKLSQYFLKHYYEQFILQGGIWAQGRSEIDATSIANIFYYKKARQLLYLQLVLRIYFTIKKRASYCICNWQKKLFRLS